MKAHVVYDSAYGNTKSVAEAVAGSLGELARHPRPGQRLPARRPGGGGPARPRQPHQRLASDAEDHRAALGAGGRCTSTGVKAAAFDTRVRMFVHGDAAKKMAHALKDSGADIISEPMPFYVQGSEGPLRPGEIEKATPRWGQSLMLEAVGTAMKDAGRIVMLVLGTLAALLGLGLLAGAGATGWANYQQRDGGYLHHPVGALHGGLLRPALRRGSTS